jgi:4-amino-4-deoxy-L-arabinose transferase-like glycosyltransferase
MMRRWPTFTSSALFHSLLLALPFLVGIVALRGLTVRLGVYQGMDETSHYAAVLAFARQFPLVDLHRTYHTSSGPLMYWVYAAFTGLWGPELFKLRLLNVAVSYATTLAIYFMLRRTLSTRPWVSFSLAALVGLSPYLFGQTFVVLSDNFMYLWLVLALDSVLRFVRAPAFRTLVLAAVFTSLAMLSRQFAIWLVPTAGLAVWAAWKEPARRWTGLAVVAGSCIPLGLVMLAWGGIVQPGSGGMASVGWSRYSAFSQALAVVGLSTVMVVPLSRLKRLSADMVRGPLLAVVAVAAVAGLVYDSIPQMPFQFGYLGLLASIYPAFLKTGVVYWVLTPIGAVFVAWSLSAYRDDPVKRVASFALVLVTLTSLASAVYFQRYVDVPILLLVAVLASGDEDVQSLDLVRWWVLAAGFVGWIFAFNH